jgi:hypothetical protein
MRKSQSLELLNIIDIKVLIKYFFTLIPLKAFDILKPKQLSKFIPYQ